MQLKTKTPCPEVTVTVWRPWRVSPTHFYIYPKLPTGWLGSRVVSVLDSATEEPRFKSQPRRCRVTVLGKLFTPIVPLFTKQRNWLLPS